MVVPKTITVNECRVRGEVMEYYTRLFCGVAFGAGMVAYALLDSSFCYWMALAGLFLYILYDTFHDIGPRWERAKKDTDQ